MPPGRHIKNRKGHFHHFYYIILSRPPTKESATPSFFLSSLPSCMTRSADSLGDRLWILRAAKSRNLKLSLDRTFHSRSQAAFSIPSITLINVFTFMYSWYSTKCAKKYTNKFFASPETFDLSMYFAQLWKRKVDFFFFFFKKEKSILFRGKANLHCYYQVSFHLIIICITVYRVCSKVWLIGKVIHEPCTVPVKVQYIHCVIPAAAAITRKS